MVDGGCGGGRVMSQNGGNDGTVEREICLYKDAKLKMSCDHVCYGLMGVGYFCLFLGFVFQERGNHAPII